MSARRQPTNDRLMHARLARAVDLAGTHSMADVAAMIKLGYAQWWCNGDGAVVTEIRDFPRGKVVNYWLVAGELCACLRLQPKIDAWAMDQGCAVASAIGRRQWAPVLAPYGWTVDACSYRKPLERSGTG